MHYLSNLKVQTKQEQLDYLYTKYKEKKQQIKDAEELRIKERVQAEGRYQLLRKEMEQASKRRDNLKRLYQKIVKEGLNYDDSERVVSRFELKEKEKSELTVGTQPSTLYNQT